MVLALGVVLAATRAGFCRVDFMGFFLLSTLRGVGRPTGGLNAELLCVRGVQSLPAAELHRLATSDAADGSSAEKVIQNIRSEEHTSELQSLRHLVCRL